MGLDLRLRAEMTPDPYNDLSIGERPLTKQNDANKGNQPKVTIAPLNFAMLIGIPEISEAIGKIADECASDTTKSMPEPTLEAYMKHPKIAKAWAESRVRLKASAAKELEDKAAKDKAEADKKQKEKTDKQTDDAKADNKPSLLVRFVKKAFKLLLIAVVVLALLSLICFGLTKLMQDGAAVTVQVGGTTVPVISVPNHGAELAAKDAEISRLGDEIKRLEAVNTANVNSASRVQGDLQNQLAAAQRDLSYYSSSALGTDLDRVKAQLVTANGTIAQLRSDVATQVAANERLVADHLVALRQQASRFVEESSASERRLRAEGAAAIASKDATIANLRWQVANDQVVLETYRSTANGENAHLGERVNVDVVAYAPRDFPFQLTLDSGLRTDNGVAIIQTVTGTSNNSFPRPSATFQANAGLYTVGFQINGRSGETFRQFLGTAGETVYMNLNGEKTSDGKTLFRQYTFSRATVLIWKGSCQVIRAIPRVNEIPLLNGSVVELINGTRVEVINRQPVVLASAP